jgi:release factor glutamine methyltransferase
MNYQEMAWYCGRDFDFFERLFQQLPDYYHVSNQILMILSEDCNISRIKEIGAKHRFEFHLILKRRKVGEWNYIYNIGRHNG